MARILLVEDDQMMAHAVKVALKQANYAVDLVYNAEDALESLKVTSYDVMVLDVNLPKKSGLELVKDMRRSEIKTPVLMLTAQDTIKQKVEGLNSGADDYLVKPFDLEELLARLQALQRRGNQRSEIEIQIGSITFDLSAKSVHKKGKLVDLSHREYAIMAVLLENRGKILNKPQIEDKLYGWDIEIESNVIEVHVCNLRKKLGSKIIKTVKGLGYIVEKVA